MSRDIMRVENPRNDKTQDNLIGINWQMSVQKWKQSTSIYFYPRMMILIKNKFVLPVLIYLVVLQSEVILALEALAIY